ncbi:MAG TPA: carboxypeptidase-like regulatory domain-containing protein [Candidatus Angelobacter sp.]
MASVRHIQFLLLLALSSGLSAQTTRPPAPALVEGHVVNKLTGAPVKGAHVIYTRLASSAEAALPISTDSDSQGQFHIELTPGSYRLWVERPGFSRLNYGARTTEAPGDTLGLAAGQEIHDVTFRITPLGAISGRLLDDDGEPVQGAGIQVLRVSYATEKRRLVPVSGASSNDRGEYRCYDLPPGWYFLLATPRGAPLTRPAERDALVPEMQDPYAPLYYPGVLDLGSASPVAVPEGGDVPDVNFRMQKVRAVTVRGRLLSPVNLGQSQVQVVLAHNERETASYVDRAAAAVDAATGRFEIRGVVPGLYFLIATQLHSGRALAARIPIDVSSSAPPQDVVLPLAQGPDLIGNVVMDGAAKLPPDVTVRLVSVEGLAAGPPPFGKVGPDGRFHLPAVLPGLWNLSLEQLPAGVWIKSATFGELDVTAADLIVSGGGTGPLRIVLAEGGADVSGVVEQEGQPLKSTIVLAPTEPDLKDAPQMYRSTSTGDHGTFAFKGVRPGAYKLYAFESIEPFAWLNPDVLKPIEEMGEAITVSPGEKLSRRLVPVPYEALLPPH